MMGIRYFVGIDPGKSGAFVSMTNTGYIEAYKIPVLPGSGRKEYDLFEISGLLLNLEPAKDLNLFVTIERPQALPSVINGKQVGGSIANFERGQSMGWLWMMTALNIPFETVSPRRWQKEMLADIPGTDTKQRALVAARRLWPNADWMIPKGCRKPHDGIIDAALICEYGRRRHGASI
jgi:hypothetical protein